MLKVFLGFFGKLFYETTSSVNEHDVLAKACVDRINNSSAEGVYANNLITSYERELNSNCKVSLFEKNMTNWFNSQIS